jgi:hypothetical protein
MIEACLNDNKKTKNGQCTRNQLEFILRLQPSLANKGPLTVLSFTYEQAQQLIARLLDMKKKKGTKRRADDNDNDQPPRRPPQK